MASFCLSIYRSSLSPLQYYISLIPSSFQKYLTFYVETFGLLLRFDFAGISLLIAGSTFSPFYYALYCNFAVAEIYLSISSSLAVICFVLGLFEFIHKRENAKYRAIIFGSFGLSMIFPLSHLVVNEMIFDNFGDPFRFSSSYPYYIGLTVSYCLGLYIFAIRYIFSYLDVLSVTILVSTISAVTATKFGTLWSS